jgi:hypothetical protein
MPQLTEMVATSQDGLKAINSVIHDVWFDIHAVRFDDGEASLSLRFDQVSSETPTTSRRFLLFREVKQVWREWVLRVEFVTGYRLEDTQGIAIYDINRIVYDPGSRTVQVLTNTPMVFQVAVESLRIVARETPLVVRQSARLIISSPFR